MTGVQTCALPISISQKEKSASHFGAFSFGNSIGSSALDCAKAGTLEEAWCVGTAAVVSPIGELYYQEQGYVVNGGRIGELSQKLYDELTGIQWGKRDDPFGWTYRV